MVAEPGQGEVGVRRMPARLLPLLLALGYVLTISFNGPFGGFLLETLFIRDYFARYATANFWHTFFFLCLGFCLLQRHVVAYCLYFCLAFAAGFWSAYLTQNYWPETMISQIPFYLIGFHFLFEMFCCLKHDPPDYRFSMKDLLKFFIFVSFAALAYRLWHAR